MATWTGHTEVKRVETIMGRRYFYFEVSGINVLPGEGVDIPTAIHGIPWHVTITYFSMVADEVITVQPTISRVAGATAGSLQREVSEDTALAKIHNQQPACMILDGNRLYVEPNVFVGPVVVKMNITLAEGHDVRGQ